MVLERTLILVKPNGLKYIPYIITTLNNVGTCRVSKFYSRTPRDLIEKLYVEHKEKEFFPWLVEYLTNQPILACVYEGDEIINNVRELIGPTDPSNASEGTIRALSDDSLELSMKERRCVRNIIHASTKDLADYELKLFFPELDTQSR